MLKIYFNIYKDQYYKAMGAGIDIHKMIGK